MIFVRRIAAIQVAVAAAIFEMAGAMQAQSSPLRSEPVALRARIAAPAQRNIGTTADTDGAR